jgi:hypothetical protein
MVRNVKKGTMINMIEKVTTAKTLWNIHCGFAPLPSDYQMGRWLKSFSVEEMEHAFDRAAAKFRNMPMNADRVDHIQRFITTVMLRKREATPMCGTRLESEEVTR